MAKQAVNIHFCSPNMQLSIRSLAQAVQRAIKAALRATSVDATQSNTAVVNLTGLLHWEERHALKYIARQLCAAFKLDFVPGASFEENLSFFKAVLTSVSKYAPHRQSFKHCSMQTLTCTAPGWSVASTSRDSGTCYNQQVTRGSTLRCRAEKSVVFVLEDFHLFMKRARPTTIYNLLDSLQTLHVCAAVVGVTCDPGAVNLMEKRARSRFSHRRVTLTQPSAARADAQVHSTTTVTAVWVLCCANRAL